MDRKVTARQYARQLNVHPNTVYAWIMKGYLPAEKRSAKNGAVRYYVDPRQPAPRITMGRPKSGEMSLSEQLLLARIEYTQLRAQLLRDRIEREAKESEESSEPIGIHVTFDDESLAE